MQQSHEPKGADMQGTDHASHSGFAVPRLTRRAALRLGFAGAGAGSLLAIMGATVPPAARSVTVSGRSSAMVSYSPGAICRA